MSDVDADEEAGVVRPHRGFALSSSSLLQALRAAGAYSSMREIRIESVVSAFQDGWISPTVPLEGSRGARHEPVDPDADVAFANELADLLYGLERAKKITMSPRLAFASNFVIEQLGPFRRESDDPRDESDPVDAFLDRCDHERIAELVDSRDMTWTPTRLARHRVGLPEDERIKGLDAAKLLPVVTTGTLYRLVEEGLEDPKRRRGIDLEWLARTLALRAEEHPALEALLDAAVHEGELTLVEDGSARRWKPGGPDSKRGLGRMLDHFHWADRPDWYHHPEQKRRVDLAKSLNIGKGDVTTQVSVLIAFGFLEEDGGVLRSERALKHVLEILLDEIGARETTVRQLVDVLGKRLRPTFATIKRETKTARVALASVPDVLDEETRWVIVDDLITQWLEEVEAPVNAGTPTRAPYRGDSRPHARAPYKLRVRLTPDAFTFLETCCVCAKPWGEAELLSRILGEWWRDAAVTTPLIHAACAPATLRASRRAGRLLQLPCAKCKGEIEPVDPGPVMARDLKTPDIGAFLEGWSGTRDRLERHLAAAETAAPSKVVAEKIQALKDRLSRLDQVDLRKKADVDGLIEECFQLTKLMVVKPGSGTLEYEPHRGVPVTFHSGDLRDAVWAVDRERPRVFRARWAGRILHAHCA